MTNIRWGLFLTLLIALTLLISNGCHTSSSNNPTGPSSTNSDLVGSWRCVAYAMIPPGTSILHAQIVTDSNYMVIDANLHFSASYRLTNGNIQHYTGQLVYNAPTLTATIDTAQSAGQGGADTVVHGSVVRYTVITLNSTTMDLRDTTTSYHIPEYKGYLKVGTDVKIGGLVTDASGSLVVANVPITGVSASSRTYSGTMSNSWGFYGAAGLTVENWRMHGVLNGVAYDDDTLHISVPGVYTCQLMQ